MEYFWAALWVWLAWNLAPLVFIAVCAALIYGVAFGYVAWMVKVRPYLPGARRQPKKEIHT